MKRHLFFLIGLLIPALLQSQFKTASIDSISQLYSTAKTDSSKVNIALSLSYNYALLNIDSAIKYANEAVELANSLNNKKLVLIAKYALAQALAERDIPASMKIYYEILELASKLDKRPLIASCFTQIGLLYLYTGSDEKYIYYLRKSKSIYNALGNLSAVSSSNAEIGGIYSTINRDSARYYLNLAAADSSASNSAFYQYYWGITESIDNPQKARGHFLKSLEISEKGNDLRGYSLASRWYCIFLQNQNQIDSAIVVAKAGLTAADKLGFLRGIVKNSEQLHKIYNGLGQTDSAYKFLSINFKAQDDLLGQDKIDQIQQAIIGEQQRAQKLQLEKEQLQSQIRLFGTGAVAFILLIFMLFFYRNQRKTRKSNELLLMQSEEINKKNSELQTSYENLKSTQSQLIQSEKMASLGELTAGIAHEIQNPLNFVNNFSEVNEELLGEMKDELDKGNINDAKAIANDAIENQQKIIHHGKRADAIVKGMLQHSRSSSSLKEPTDINALCDEYLRLSYHGLRAKDKSFNATMKTDFDNSIGNINIIPQDFGRVILNLLTNAFYAVQQKQKEAAGGLPTFERLATLYEPTVTITTKKEGDKVLISVSDNGNGIPQNIVDKIFQPFFTTKPTGQGTGLGLSLSYDIVTKGHGGELKVETKEARPDDPVGRGEGTVFIIQLPTT
ncbi:MAG: ATP-binding protein [Bacteroidota bacterium]|nr:ATP-binding protein [Bacteroidota bacterium]